MDAKTDLLNHPDLADRMLALEDLADQASLELVLPVAAQLLADQDAGVRETAARLLVESSTEAAALLTVPHIAAPDLTVRNLAGQVLVRMGPPALAALAPFVDDDNPEVRKFTIDLLAQLPAEALAERIAAHLRDTDPNVRIAAIDALGAWGTPAYADTLKQLYQEDPAVRPNVLATFAALGPEAGHALVAQALADPEPVVQYTAAETLAFWKVPEAFDLLLDKLEGVDPMARPVVLHSLVSLCEDHQGTAKPFPSRIRPYLLDMLDDHDPTYQQTAVNGLRFFLDDVTVETLLVHLGENDALDLEIFKTVVSYPDVFRCLLRVIAANAVAPEQAAQMLLGLLSQEAIEEKDFPVAGAFLHREFDALSLETIVAVVNLCEQLDDLAFNRVLSRARMSSDDAVCFSPPA